MKTAIIVKKYTAERISFRVILVCWVLFTLLFVVVPQQYPLLLVALPFVAIFFFLLVYYESWQISFDKKTIIRRVLFVRIGIYSYSQISDVFESYSETNHEYIMLVFSNGDKFSFRLKDENAYLAKKLINTHHSIRKM